MRQLRLFVGLSLMSLCALASGDHETFYLKKDQTISHLLYNDLGVRPLYGDDNVLNQILVYNNLTYKEAKSLPVNFKVNVPAEYLPKNIESSEIPVEPEILEEPVVDETPEPSAQITETEIPVKDWVSFHMGVYSYKGASNTDDRFSGSGGLAGVRSDFENQISSTYFMNYEGNFNFFYLRDTTDQIGIELDGNLSINRYSPIYGSLGLGAGLARRFYLYTRDVEDDLRHYYVPLAFLNYAYDFEKWSLNTRFGFNFQSVFGGPDTSTTPFIQAGVSYPVSEKWRIGFEFSYEKKDVETFEQDLNRYLGNLSYLY